LHQRAPQRRWRRIEGLIGPADRRHPEAVARQRQRRRLEGGPDAASSASGFVARAHRLRAALSFPTDIGCHAKSWSLYIIINHCDSKLVSNTKNSIVSKQKL
jgi:hypothetical protein